MALRGAGAPHRSSGHETPLLEIPAPPRSSRRLCGAPALSPTKRRKQRHTEDAPFLSAKSADCGRVPVQRPVDGCSRVPLLHEVLCRLSVRDIAEAAAPVARLWRDAAHSKDLWRSLVHVRLVDRLRIVEKVVERRSKGKLFRSRRFDTDEDILLRVVDLELTNAGRDDGVPTSFLREVALLRQIRHPNVIGFYGADILGRQAVVCTEYAHENFTSWFGRLELGGDRLPEIQAKFSQLLTGLSYVHRQGIMHRNLKPDNLFIDALGTVKIGDFSTTRMLDVPVGAYTPEDPKERDRSAREMRRLWYRAPELILRDAVYGPQVDIWAVGCLLVEAATGKPLFPSDSEVDHLFRVFRVIGTPTPAAWPEILTMKGFSPRFPSYAKFNLEQVAAAVLGSAAHQNAVKEMAVPDRADEMRHLVSAASSLGPRGMFAVDRALTVPPSARASADELLASVAAFGADASVPFCLLGVERGMPSSGEAQPTFAADLLAPGMSWAVVEMMLDREQSGVCATPTADSNDGRAALVDFVIALASVLGLNDSTLHLAVALLDKHLATRDGVSATLEVDKGAASACLKIADVFCEQSKEYYKQENAAEYAEACQGISTAEVLRHEKELLPQFAFDLRQPTAGWFLQAFLAHAGLSASCRVARIAQFLNDLALLDDQLLVHAPSMRAQAALVLAAYVAHCAVAAPMVTSSRLVLPALEVWDHTVRERACGRNAAVAAAMCLEAFVHVLVVRRRAWKNSLLLAAEAKHAALAATLAYPEQFSVSRMVRYMLPDSQRGIMPE